MVFPSSLDENLLGVDGAQQVVGRVVVVGVRMSREENDHESGIASAPNRGGR